MARPENRGKHVRFENPNPTGAEGPCVWAVGGGKGGVGKSMLSSSLGAAIAETGLRCTVVDADLGGANVHTLLGVPRPSQTLTHFINGDVADLNEIVTDTPVKGLSVVSGSRAMLEMANLKHAQKEKLLRHVHRLEVDHVILDLGAGSSYNVLDFFNAARRALVVVVPEPTSIENAYHFLRAAFYRALRSVAKRPEARAAIRRVIDERAEHPVRSARELIHRVQEIDPLAGKLLVERAAAFAPKLIINQAETAEHRRIGWDVAAACREHLGVRLDYLGAVDVDSHVSEALVHHQPVMQRFPLCRFSKRVSAIADRLLRDVGPMTPPMGASHRDTYALASYGLGGPPGRRRPRKATVARLVGAPASAAADAPRIERRSASGVTLDPAAPGTYLRLCREAMGASLDEMTDRTRIRGLARIEQERFEELPPEPYLSGFVLQYARALGVRDVELLLLAFLERYRDACGPGDPECASG